MAEHNAEIAAITGSAATPSFANMIEALERAGRLLDRVSRVFFNLESSETNDALEAMPHVTRQSSPNTKRGSRTTMICLGELRSFTSDMKHSD